MAARKSQTVGVLVPTVLSNPSFRAVGDGQRSAQVQVPEIHELEPGQPGQLDAGEGLERLPPPITADLRTADAGRKRFFVGARAGRNPSGTGLGSFQTQCFTAAGLRIAPQKAMWFESAKASGTDWDEEGAAHTPKQGFSFKAG